MVRDSLPEDLQPYEAALGSMVRDALARYCRDYAVVRATTSTIRGERNNIHDCMRAVAKTMFTEFTETTIRFEIHLGRYRARCKKFSESLETANYPTQAVIEFEGQVVQPRQLLLFPDSVTTNIYVGYVPSPVLTESTVWVVQPGPGGWSYQLRPDTGVMPVPIPPATGPNVGSPRTRIEPKRSKVRKFTDAKE